MLGVEIHSMYTPLNAFFCLFFFLVVLALLMVLFCTQAEELRKSLWAKNVPAKVYVGMRYWHPFTEEAIEQVLGHLVLRIPCEIALHLLRLCH